MTTNIPVLQFAPSIGVSVASLVVSGPVKNALDLRLLSGTTLSTSLNDVDAYDSGRATGQAAFVFKSSDDSVGPTKLERYGAWIAYTGQGTGSPAVESSTFALGVSNLKKNWFATTVPGQTIGMHIVTRGGYFGADANSTMPDPDHPGQTLYGGYNPAGDITNIIINSVQASPYAQQAAAEMSIHYANQGRFDADHNVHSMNVQIAPMRILNPDGTSANPGIGVSFTASAGNLGYVIQAVNTARPGSYNNGTPGIWGGFLRYNLDDGGTRAPFDAFKVDQQGWIRLNSGLPTAPEKVLRVGSVGSLEVLNNAGAVIASFTEAGDLLLGPTSKRPTVVFDAWATTTPTLTPTSGTISAPSGTVRYLQVGKEVKFNASVTLTLSATATGVYVSMPVPSGPQNSYAVGRSSTGKSLIAEVGASGGTALVLNDDGTSFAAGTYTLKFSGSYEAA